MSCNFSYDHYKEIARLIKDNGYKTIFFHEDSSSDEVIIMRHDVDVDLDGAARMAEIENECGIKSTYFIWINSPFYNIFEKRYIDAINKILSLGHEIGLHFDETVYECNTAKQMIKYIDKEASLIEGYFNTSIKSVSFHRPSPLILENDIDLGKYINTYSKEFFKDFKYISDSAGRWREGCACGILKEKKYNKLQIVTHPIWWKAEHLKNQQRLIKYINFKTEKLNDDISNNIKTYEKKPIKLVFEE